MCASAVVMLDAPYFEVVCRILDTHSNRQFPLHFPSHASPCAITFQLDSTNLCVQIHKIKYGKENPRKYRCSTGSGRRCMASNRCIPVNPLNAELNPICYLLALLGPHHILHVSRVRVKSTMIWSAVVSCVCQLILLCATQTICRRAPPPRQAIAR
jgi:hypothetical protein